MSNSCSTMFNHNVSDISSAVTTPESAPQRCSLLNAASAGPPSNKSHTNRLEYRLASNCTKTSATKGFTKHLTLPASEQGMKSLHKSCHSIALQKSPRSWRTKDWAPEARNASRSAHKTTSLVQKLDKVP